MGMRCNRELGEDRGAVECNGGVQAAKRAA